MHILNRRTEFKGVKHLLIQYIGLYGGILKLPTFSKAELALDAVIARSDLSIIYETNSRCIQIKQVFISQ